MTFSITAHCKRTNQFGMAIATKVIAVGARCLYAKAKVGAVMTQAFNNPYLGIDGLAYLQEGYSARKTLAKVLAADPAPEIRQVSIIDTLGAVAVHSGEKCEGYFGHQAGE